MAKEEIEEELNEKSSHKLLNIFLFIIVFSIALIMYSRYIGTKGLKVKEYRIASDNIPVSFSGLKIVQLSDIYIGNTTTIKDLKNIVDEVNVLKPDIVVFTGNLISSSYKLKAEQKTEIINLLNDLYSTTGKYAVKGKEDYNETFDQIISNTNFLTLNNTSDIVYYNDLTPIFIGGLDYKHPNLSEMYSYYELNLEEKDTKANYKIILSSVGDNAELILKNEFGADLILAGNSLNGCVNLPLYGPLFVPKGSKKYYKPYYKKENTDIYISSGIGTDNHPYRLFNKPSFNLYRLKSL